MGAVLSIKYMHCYDNVLSARFKVAACYLVLLSMLSGLSASASYNNSGYHGNERGAIDPVSDLHTDAALPQEGALTLLSWADTRFVKTDAQEFNRNAPAINYSEADIVTRHGSMELTRIFAFREPPDSASSIGPRFKFIEDISVSLDNEAYNNEPVSIPPLRSVPLSSAEIDGLLSDAVSLNGKNGFINEEYSDFIERADPTASTGIYIWPASGTLTSAYGRRSSSVGSSNHKGIDIAASRGTPIYAADGGEVIVSETSNSFGKYIRILHDNGHITLYAHCDSLLVKAGERVAQGQIIARMGQTGVSSGVHLHFEIIVDGTNVNPLPRLTG